ncbi:Putative secreted protein OS=Castellaniella defragrans OX=75697 GN=HNR28_002662 PE=4 SV=1 [Castellaniella defragrans]
MAIGTLLLKKFWRALAASTALATATAMAAPAMQPAEPLAAHAAQPSEPEATLSAQAGVEVAQDRVRITLAAELSGPTQEQVSQKLNERLQATMKQAKGHEGIDVQSGSYRIWPMNDRDGKVSEWRGHAEILLESGDFAAASRLASTLAAHMPVAGLAFSVSDERRAAEEQKLLTQAVSAFKQRAGDLAEALGFGGYRLKTLDLGGSGGVPVSPAPRMMAMAASSAAVPVEGGRERITVSIQGTVFLLPK